MSLDRRAVAIDIDTTDDLTLAGHVELLEGLDIGDQEFEDWLREERERFSRRRTTAAPPTLTTATADPRPAAGPRTGHRLLLEREAGSASNAATLVAELERHAPEVLRSVTAALAGATRDLDFVRLQPAAFTAATCVV